MTRRFTDATKNYIIMEDGTIIPANDPKNMRCKRLLQEDPNLETVLDADEPVISEQQIINSAETAIKAFRRLFGFSDAGQSSTYQAKLAQAKAYAEAAYPSPLGAGEYLYLVEGIVGQDFTKRELADAIIAKAEIYEAINAKIEAARVLVKVVVEAAADEGKQAAADLVVSNLQIEVDAALVGY